jgi:hypothetical protein
LNCEDGYRLSKAWVHTPPSHHPAVADPLYYPDWGEGEKEDDKNARGNFHHLLSINTRPLKCIPHLFSGSSVSQNIFYNLFSLAT